MSPKIMDTLPSSNEIIELTEKHDSESGLRENTGKQQLRKPLKKHAIEDDINKLFEAIEIGSSRQRQGIIGQTERHFRDALHKSAMKRPMRVAPSQAVSGIGISESLSLKQALRGLCISQASEMAAVKKRMLRPSASPGISEAGAFKKLYRAVVIEAGQAGQPLDEDKGNLLEISLVPESSLLNISDKATERQSSVLFEDAPTPGTNITKARMEDDVNPFSTEVACELPDLDEIVSIPGESSKTARGQNKGREDKLKSASLSSKDFNEETEVIKNSNIGVGSSKQSLRTRNFVKKKIIPKSAFAAKSCSPHTEGAKNNHNAKSVPEMVCEESDKVSPASSSNSNLITSATPPDFNTSKPDLVPHIVSKTKSVVMKADERSRSREKAEFSQSSKSSIGEYSSTTSYSEESYLSGPGHSCSRPHKSKDLRWEAISCFQKQQGTLGMRHFKLLRRIGGGDIGTVYLSELIGTKCLFAVKVMDNEFLLSRKKMIRAQTEKEILEILDHPFLPTLYAHFATNKFSCLVMEYCPGGDLHVLRQKQLTRSFPEKAARFYAAEVLLALEYLHMLGVVYRDLKPENILVREDGHIMLSDFDLSLRCAVNPMLLKSSSPIVEPPKKISSPCSNSSCIDPFCLQPSWQLSCFTPGFLSAASRTRKLNTELANQVISLPQLVVEPTSARSNSFVGTHEYLAPEIIKGEGHGSVVDWWTFGIFLYELLYGKTPFKGTTNEETISNVVSQCLKFPQYPMVSSHTRDLIRRLLNKEPESRLGSGKGAAEIKQHPFFEGLNWALIRCKTPPELPKFFDLGNVVPNTISESKTSKSRKEFDHRGDGIEFEMF